MALRPPPRRRSETPRITVIGLAGGVGAGKSTVAAILASLGCLVLDADAQVRALLDTPEVRDQLVGWWGGSILGGDGMVDRKAVAAIVFAGPEQLRRLESLLHPRVIQAQREAIEGADPKVTPAVVLDVPLLFEAGMDSACDAVIFVDTPEPLRLARVRSSRGWDEAELARRQASQWPMETKKAKSSFVVMNAGDRTDLEEQVREAFEQIRPDPEPEPRS